ncbi:MAG: Gfo/Idh/MocA family oxidoreductase [Planctomycetota bacterium]|jgi:predicted dehydrogenase
MSKINRRGFLKTSVAAAGAMAISGRSVSVAAPRRGPNEEIRVAVVGIRGQGHSHIKHHTKAKNVRVVTICDVDEQLFANRIRTITDMGKPAPKTEYDLRRIMDDKDVDCISTATPNHWHALITIWACQAGKDVYVQKPCSHNISEGRKMIEAARKYNRIVQHGTQKRSKANFQQAIKLLHQGIIGEVYMARGLCYKPRPSIGNCADGVGTGQEHEYFDHGRKATNYDRSYLDKVHYDLWLGPAPKRPFNYNRFHYNWHWNWDYGNGEIGNQGVHEMDVAMWGLGKSNAHPVKAHSTGGRYTYRDQGQTPNTQVATFHYDDGKMLVFEVRGRQTNSEVDTRVGNIFYGSKGYMVVSGKKCETFIDGKPGPQSQRKDSSANNFQNFHNAVRSRKVSDLNADIAVGHHAATLCHLANISYRLGRSLKFDPKTETFGSDHEANALLTRHYRKPFEVPDKV